MTSNMQANYWWVTHHVSSPPPAHDSSLWAQQTSLLRWWQTDQWVSCQELKCRCLVFVFAVHFLCIVLHWGSFNYRSTQKLVANLVASNTSFYNFTVCTTFNRSTQWNNVQKDQKTFVLLVLPVRRAVCSVNIQYEWTCRRKSCDIPALLVLTPFSLHLFLCFVFCCADQ